MRAIQYSSLNASDTRLVWGRLPRDVQKMLREHRLFLAGGFIRETIAGNCPKDIDLFGPSKDYLKLVMESIHGGREDSRIFSTNNAITILAPPRLPVQAITRWLYDDPTKLVEEFDFTVCQAVIWFDPETKTLRSVCHPDFYADLAARRLVYTAPNRAEDAGGSMLRVVKFLRRGYNIQPPALGAVIGRLVKAVDYPDKMDEHAAGRIVAGLLLEVDPLSVIDGVEFRDEAEEL